jgi:hypothetical protein
LRFLVTENLILGNHLEKKHPEKFREKLEAFREKEESQKKRKIALERQQAFFKPKPSDAPPCPQ